MSLVSIILLLYGFPIGTLFSFLTLGPNSLALLFSQFLLNHTSSSRLTNSNYKSTTLSVHYKSLGEHNTVCQAIAAVQSGNTLLVKCIRFTSKITFLALHIFALNDQAISWNLISHLELNHISDDKLGRVEGGRDIGTTT